MVATLILTSQHVVVFLVTILFFLTLAKVIWWTIMGDWPASVKQEFYIQHLANQMLPEDWESVVGDDLPFLKDVLNGDGTSVHRASRIIDSFRNALFVR